MCNTLLQNIEGKRYLPQNFFDTLEYLFQMQLMLKSLLMITDDDALYESERLVVAAVLKPLQEQVAKLQEYEEAQLLSHLISAGSLMMVGAMSYQKHCTVYHSKKIQ